MPESIIPAKRPLLAGIKHEEWSEWDCYIGPKALLIQQGLVQEGRFPGDPGCAKTSMAFTADGTRRIHGESSGLGPTALRIERLGPSRFRVRLPRSAEEVEQRKAARARSEELERVQREATDDERLALEQLAELPATGEDWARRSADLFWITWNTVYRSYCQRAADESGFSYCKEDRDNFSRLANALYWEMREATPLLDETKRLAKITAARAKTAQIDESLQRFLKRIVQQKSFDTIAESD